MKRLFFLITLCCSAGLSSFAQEICNNGIDDDDNGFVDCYDKVCAKQLKCDTTFNGHGGGCDVNYPPAPQFTMQLDYETDDETASHLGRVVVGDLDRDGIPEMVTINKQKSQILIINGRTGKVKKAVTTSFAPTYEDIAIANIDNDNCAEIFVIDGAWNLYSFDCNLNQLWTGTIPGGKVSLPGDPGMFGLADFPGPTSTRPDRGDGKVEIYVRGSIYDAHTGIELVQYDPALLGSWGQSNGGPVAIDMNKDKKLDLVIGLSIYNVDLGARTFRSGKLTLQKGRSDYFARTLLSSTSVADFNLNGSIDIIASGSTGGFNKNTTIFFWDPVTDEFKTFIDPETDVTKNAYTPNGWGNGTGRINIADLDGDGKLDVSYVSGKYLYSLDENFVKKPWAPKVVNEETSGYTGCTLFDFNGDGISEIVYRDEQYLYIINGKTGVEYPGRQICVSRTNREYPIVVDVDADGSTEICVTCRTKNFVPGIYSNSPLETNDHHNFYDGNAQRYSQVRVFKSANEPWVPARRLWNQHAYFVVNVRDDLTIPRTQQSPEVAFTLNPIPCQNDKTPLIRRPFNNFLNQSPYVDTLGCPAFISSDLGFVGNPQTPKPVCPDKNFDITFTLINTGELSLNADYPITFYKNRPTKAGSVKLNTVIKKITNMKKGNQITITIPVQGTGEDFELFIVLNDDGKINPPIDSTRNASTIIDCPSNNMINIHVTPEIAPITVNITDNLQCIGSSSPPNGTASAFVDVNGVPNNTDFTFTWSDGFVGPTHTGMAGNYTVTAVHKTALCNAELKPVFVPTTDAPLPELSILSFKDVDNCAIPNGEADVLVKKNGAIVPNSNYTFKWFEGTDVTSGQVVSVTHDATKLSAKTYTVEVTEKTTGCSATTPQTIADATPILLPVASTIDDDCSVTDKGELHVQSITRNSVTETDLTKYTYNWFDGNSPKPLPDYTGIDITGRAGGSYTLVAFDPISACSSVAVPVTIAQTLPPNIISVDPKAKQRSCDPLAPNGEAEVIVDNVLKYNYEWFRGQGTSTPFIPAETSPIVKKLKTGIYTIQIEDKITKCKATGEVTIEDGIMPLTISPSATAISFCSPKNGKIDMSVLPFDATAVYTYFLDDGVNPIVSQAGSSFTGLDDGTYTVWAKNTLTACETNNVPATILDGRTPITIDPPAIAPSLTCKGDGSITIRVNSSGPSGFKFEWFRGDASDPSTAIPTEPTLPNSTTQSSIKQPKGNYTVKITNLLTLCSTELQFEILYIGDPQLTVVKEDIKKCGSLQGGAIITTLVPFTGLSDSNYDLYIYSGGVDPDPAITGLPVPIYAYNTALNTGTYTTKPIKSFDPGLYTVVSLDVSGNEPGCRVSRTTSLNRVTSNPIVSAKLTSNTLCFTGPGAAGNGKIELSMGIASPPEPNNNPAFYNYIWTPNPPAISTTEIASNLPSSGGPYNVTVTFNATAPAFEGCSTTKQYSVPSNQQVISLKPPTLVNVQNCDPLNGFIFLSNGTATINNGDITDNGLSTNPTTPPYSIQWLKKDGTSAGLNGSSVNSLAVGDYSVVVTNQLNTGCSQTQDFTITNKPVTVGLNLKTFEKQLRCAGPIGGYLEVEPNPTGATLPYTYEWYSAGTKSAPTTPNFLVAGDKTAAAVAPGRERLIGLVNDERVAVRIQNNDNNCWATDTYVMTQKFTPISIRAFSATLTNCENNSLSLPTPTNENVKMEVAILQPIVPNDPLIPLNYSYSWTFDGVEQYTTAIANVTKLVYKNVDEIKVSVEDQTDPIPECATSAIVTIDSLRLPFVPFADKLLSVTTCKTDPADQNGAAEAYVLTSTGRDIINYVFDWYIGNPPPSGASPLANSGPVMTGLFGELIYTVTATNRITGCVNSDTVAIDKKPITLGIVDLVATDQTNCLEILPDGTTLEPNGTIQVKVERPQDYSFVWTDVNNTVLTDEVAYLVDSLNSGVYKVTVKNLDTKCESFGQGEIITNQVIPDYVFSVEASVCNERDEIVNTGTAKLFLTNYVEVAKIWWDAVPPSTDEVIGNTISNVPKGTYTAHVLTINGCSSKDTVSIGTEIHDYNFISRNGDESNSHFHIGCIESFPNNNVKIYNRAGTLVYEANGYDNSVTSFNGKSNKGVNLMGNDLPAGTYFYIINKRDGSKQIAGYLEIVD